ncbi:MAG TPA: hypothetical protein VFN67_26115 [Polyangiales bacterium]|nr:hypothetical protein [Polyangiales bacterium]
MTVKAATNVESQWANEAPKASQPERSTRLTRLLEHPRLPWLIVALGVLLTAPSLFIGFHLDDFIGRFIFSDAEGAQRLFDIYSGGYGAANGNPVDAAWMMEEGYAPWWMDPDVLLWFWRPLSLWTHLLDAALWPSSAFLWHLHSLLWFAVLLWCAVSMFRSFQGPVIGGLAALLFAVDHTHALPVAFITNRYALITTALCMLTLQQHHANAQGGSAAARWFAALCYGLALFAGESSAAIVGYLVCYALFLDTRSLRSRLLSLAPYFVVSGLWRAIYNSLGHGARFSDLYIDPAREPLRFTLALLERAPTLLLGQWFMPPAETFTLVDSTSAALLIAFAWLFTIALAIALWPLFRRDRVARFWAGGMALSIVPMCSGEPNNRMLFIASIGAAGLIACWWNAYAAKQVPWDPEPIKNALTTFSRRFGKTMVVGHLFVAPFLVPINATGMMLYTAIQKSFDDVGEEAVGRDAVFVTSPDYFAVRLLKMTKAVEHKPSPARVRGLAYGPEQITLERPSANTLILNYAGGAMHEPAVTKQALDLYRTIKRPMHKGQKVALEGLDIELLEVTDDGRPLRARFDFAEPLEADRYRFYNWADNGFQKLKVPAVGETKVLPRATLEPELPGS